MKTNGIVYITYLALCSLVAIYFMFTGGAQSEPSSEADDLAALLSGQTDQIGGGDEVRTGIPDNDSGSLFNSEFWEVGAAQGPIEDEPLEARPEDGEPDILEPANPNNPKNPMTGEVYPDRVMKVFNNLRKRFPNNSMIPKRQTPEEKAAEATERNKVFGLQSLIAQGKATEEQVSTFYNYQMKQYKDRAELVDYVLTEKGATMSPDIKQQYQKIQQMTATQLQSFEKQREQALARIQ
ncbi:MAG: hypothetical protein NXI24_00090 [bacterium]|nr:hypothetical protein [bacterium]